ncbi:MAG TPA: zinc ribbon domain-containing protein [Deltaproteobacteria bacterium]|nr:zinc ribbon domain-containing protein [Deltaproteobacteria bacterium]
MPIYEYKCLKCNNEFEAMQKFSDSALSQCPNCGGPVKKLISRSSFHLKGSGWYLTDYAQKNSPKETHHKSESSENTTEKPSSSPSTTSTTESD